MTPSLFPSPNRISHPNQSGGPPKGNGPAGIAWVMPALFLLCSACSPLAEQDADLEGLSSDPTADANSQADLDRGPEPITAPQVFEIIKSQELPVVVTLWAGWHPEARANTPQMLPLQRAHQAGRIHWIWIALETEAEARKNTIPGLRSLGIQIPIRIQSPDESDADFLQTLCSDWSGTLPTTLVFHPNGTLNKRFEGPASASEILAVIESSDVP